MHRGKPAGDRGEVDEIAASALDHAGQGRHRDVDRAEVVDLRDAIDQPRVLPQQQVGRHDGGRIHDTVDRAQLGFDPADGGGDGGLVGHVQGERTDRRRVPRGLEQARFVDVDRGDRCTLGRELARGQATHAAARAGDECDRSIESHWDPPIRRDDEGRDSKSPRGRRDSARRSAIGSRGFALRSDAEAPGDPEGCCRSGGSECVSWGAAPPSTWLTRPRHLATCPASPGPTGVPRIPDFRSAHSERDPREAPPWHAAAL